MRYSRVDGGGRGNGAGEGGVAALDANVWCSPAADLGRWETDAESRRHYRGEDGNSAASWWEK